MLTTLSLKSRLIAASTAWVALGMLAAWLALSAVFERHVTEQFYEELFVHLDELQRLASIGPERAVLTHNLSDPRYEVPRSGYYWEIQKDGNVLARSPSMQASMLKTPPDKPTDVDVHTHSIAGPTGELLVAERLEWKAAADKPLQFIIGTDKRHLDAVVHSFNHTLSWALAGLGLSMIVAAALAILFAMRPMEEMRASLARVRAGQAKRLTGSFPVEVQPLVDDLNSLLSTTSDLIQRARTQSGNIAHSLKTPLAILTDEAYRIASQGQQDSSATILEQCRKMQSRIDYQTARARVVATRLSPGAYADVGEASASVTSALQRLYKDRNLTFQNTVESGTVVGCEGQDLQEILANLVDNACKNAKSTVRLSADPHAGARHVEILIEDDGPGLPPEAFEVVFEIGEQWDTQQAGTGLGLAIARDLARLYEGDIQLAPSTLGGLAARVTLPAARQHRL